MGRKHEGLENPSKFDLTYDQVVDLIDRGKWRSFRIRWNARQKLIRKIQANNYTCPICNLRKPNLSDWLVSGHYCRACAKEKEATSAIIKVCTCCKRRRVVKMQVASIQLCEECVKRYHRLVEVINESKNSTTV